MKFRLFEHSRLGHKKSLNIEYKLLHIYRMFKHISLEVLNPFKFAFLPYDYLFYAII